ncbi:MAG: hypothetical protein KatS3mg108_1901 [Isosphaeraceae bacterium]|nr:MAG: hypothetical protein KatS3mg108_1901 [Isosphaeraceae bacterium]
MTDRRDAPESALEESTPEAPARPRSTVAASTPSPLRPRLGRLALALGSLVVVLGIGWEAWSRIADWVHRHPEYQITLEEIDLIPPPPASLKGGRQALLRQIAANWGLGSTISALGCRPDDLARRLALSSSWIEAVEQVAILGHPPRLRVALRYRHPVAVLAIAGGGWIYLDRHGVVLPPAEVDPQQAGPLIAVRGWSGPIDPRPGLSLAPPGSESETRLRAAVRLCEFFQQQTARQLGQPRIVAVNLRYGPTSLYAQTDWGLWVLWGEAPGEETPGNLDANRKWQLLRIWLETHPPDPSITSDSYLIFTAESARLERFTVGGRSSD